MHRFNTREDRIIEASSTLERGARYALVSMDASMRSNLSVGPPIELLMYAVDTIDQYQQLRFEENDPFLKQTSQAWPEAFGALLSSPPRFDWETSE